ncbi:MAG: ribonuclease HII [Pseudomonadota bacterium]
MMISHTVEPHTVGVDEVGRGPLAGPVVACACHLPIGLNASWVNDLADSKKLSANARERLAAILRENVPYALGEASVAEIDTLNILQASLLAMRRAVEALQLKLGHDITLIVDGNQRIPNLTLPQKTLVQADATVPCVSAASILAKVHRDACMAALAQTYPHYGWASNAGYGSAHHMAALQEFGATPHHRSSFAPVRAVLEMEKRDAA